MDVRVSDKETDDLYPGIVLLNSKYSASSDPIVKSKRSISMLNPLQCDHELIDLEIASMSESIRQC